MSHYVHEFESDGNSMRQVYEARRDLHGLLQACRLLVLDFDGVLTIAQSRLFE